MPTYVVLLNFTEQGIQTIKSTEERSGDATAAIEAAGGKMLSSHYTMGQYDAVAIIEAPSDEVVTGLALATAGRGNIRTETLRAFTQEEFFDIVKNLP